MQTTPFATHSIGSATCAEHECYWCGSTFDLAEYQNGWDFDPLRDDEPSIITLCASCYTYEEPMACAEHPAGCPLEAA